MVRITLRERVRDEARSEYPRVPLPCSGGAAVATGEPIESRRGCGGGWSLPIRGEPYLSIHLSIYLSIDVYLSIYLSIYTCMCICTCMYILRDVESRDLPQLAKQDRHLRVAVRRLYVPVSTLLSTWEYP